MDGFGYRNWDNSGLDESYGSSPPTYTSDPYGFEPTRSDKNRGSKNKGKDVYDFEFGDDDISPEKPTKRLSNKTRRMSTDDRVNEILQQAKAAKPPIDTTTEDNVGEEDAYNSWKSSWNEIMEGVAESPNPDLTPIADSPAHSEQKPTSKMKSNRLNSSDSFDLSEADFEVGTHAARRSQEKANERRRRSAIETLPSKSSASPDIASKNRRSSMPANNNNSKPMISAGLSSIEEEDTNAPRDSMARYGSMGGKSDGDLLKYLVENRPNFRYPMDTDTTGSPSVFKSLNTDSDEPSPLTPTHSKRRQQQLLRRSLSPKPMTSSFKPTSEAKESKEVRASDDANVSYSMDDFDAMTPAKQEPSEQTQEVKAEKIVNEQTGGRDSMDEIRRRWLTNSVASSVFASIEEGNETKNTDGGGEDNVTPVEKASQSSGERYSDDEEHCTKPAEDESVRRSTTPPPPEPSRDEQDIASPIGRTSKSPVNSPPSEIPPPPPEPETVQSSIPSDPISRERSPATQPSDQVNSEQAQALKNEQERDSSPQYYTGGIEPRYSTTGDEYDTQQLPSAQPEYHHPVDTDSRSGTQKPYAIASQRYGYGAPDRTAGYESGERYDYFMPHDDNRRSAPYYQQQPIAFSDHYPPPYSVNGPRAVEIDPGEYMGSVRVSDNRSSHDPRKSSTNWPHAVLPLVPPSATELHAHIASMSTHQTTKQQISSKVSLLKSKKRVTKGRKFERSRSNDENTIKGRTVLAQSTQSIDSDDGVIDSHTSHRVSSRGIQDGSALSRIEIVNSKLLKQFEDLDREIKEMKASSTAKRKLVRKRSKSAEPAPQGSKRLDADTRRERMNREQSAAYSLQATQDLIQRQDDEALNAIRAIFRESVEKEAIIAQREMALNARESILEATQYRQLQSQQEKAWESKTKEELQSINDAQTDKIQTLENELRDLKAELYELKSADKPQTRRQSPVEANDMASSSAPDQRKLLSDISELENMCSMYERENQRLAQRLVDKDKEMRDARADFFDQQENLVKELNRLRNEVASNSAVSRSSARVTVPEEPAKHPTSRSWQQLRGDLDKDGMINSLEEQVAVLEKACTQKENSIGSLTQQINKLEKENIVLAKNLESVSKLAVDKRGIAESDFEGFAVPYLEPHRDTSAGDQEVKRGSVVEFGPHEGDEAAEIDYKQAVTELKSKLEQQRVQHFNEVKGLRAKVAWYAETQKLLEDVEQERAQLKEELESYKSNNMSVLSTSSATKPGRSNRNPSDVKRIRELESALEAARESIRKRFPDSVANLLYSNISSGDDSQLRIQSLMKERDDLKAELESCQLDMEKKITSIRQEYERMKIQHEKQVKVLQQQSSVARITSAPSDALPKGMPNSPVKTFAQSKERIQFLEAENARLRAFYTKKIEGLQKKYQAQVQAIKRGGAPEIHTGEKDKNNDRQELLNRIRFLEDELLQTSEELGKLKAISLMSSCQETKGQDTPPSQPRETSSRAPSQALSGQNDEEKTHLQNRINALEADIASLRVTVEPTASPSTSHISSLESDLRVQKEHVEKLKNQLSEYERMLREANEDFHRRIQSNHSEMKRKDDVISELQAEVLNLKDTLRVPQTPTMQQYVVMESKLSAIEDRLKNRERELLGALEQAKVAANMDRLRLQAIHEHEIREKDEQLMQFQLELEQLVSAMQQCEQQ
mmetsp:Transcript_21534/g.31284  ORF Transcript_21534/g.31284 Transcript_21534/m.31284 type:complete len:1684 (+) Transcript_21534:93-5144(+)